MEKPRRKFIRNLGIAGLSVFPGRNLLNARSNEESIIRSQMLDRQTDLTTPKIEEARKAALEILKPSKKDLEHGLELHANSIVFDTYGFMPRAAVDGQRLAKAVADNASPLEIDDLREDQTMSRFVEHEREQIEFITNWKASGVTAIFQNAGEESNNVQVLLKRLARFTYATDMMPEVLKKTLTAEAILVAKKNNLHAVCLSGNGVPMPLDLVSLEEELRYIRIFYQLGIRMMHLTYNRRNLIGDGCAEPANGGLSDFGRAVVKEMNRVGVIVDIAHSGWQTSLEAAQISEKPIVASHTTCDALYHHIRAKPDEVIKTIADKEGYISICCIPRFLGGAGNIADMLRHIDYVAKTFGPDYVGIGTDVPAQSQYNAEEAELIPPYRKARIRWEALWPEDHFKETREMRLSMAWTNWPLFTVGLVQLGYSDDDIQKIIGGNALRVFKANETRDF